MKRDFRATFDRVGDSAASQALPTHSEINRSSREKIGTDEFQNG
jgi:hypothetical protein